MQNTKTIKNIGATTMLTSTPTKKATTPTKREIRPKTILMNICHTVERSCR